MKSYLEISKQDVKSLSVVLTDIDDTLTHYGKLTLKSYEGLNLAKEAGLKVIPITGRPAGWCDMIVRQWPVDGVVGENGAFYFYLDCGRMVKHFLRTPNERKADWKKLRKIREKIFKRFPELKEASDQSYREADLAIDFREDVSNQGLLVAQNIRDFFIQNGANARISSIHVNCWFGEYNKMSTTKLFLKKVFNTDLGSNIIYFGDSPNDCPMFKEIFFSCGVGNIEKYGSLLTHKPRYAVKSDNGEGFYNVISHILKLRGS